MFNYIFKNLKVCAGMSVICFVAILFIGIIFVPFVADYVSYDEYVLIIAALSVPTGCIASYTLKL